MQVVGRAIFGDYPTPTRYYAEVRATRVTGQEPGPLDALLCTLPCNSPGRAITDGNAACVSIGSWTLVDDNLLVSL